MANKNEDISHEGHRARLTDLVYNSGLENVSSYQAVEFFLTYIFPRGDVNPLAHRLLDKYGSFGNIIDSNVNDLMAIKGINERSAKKIIMFGSLMRLYSSSKLSKKVCLKDDKEFMDILEELLRFRTTENLYIFAVDNSFNIIQKRYFDLKSIRQVGMNPLELYDFISASHPAYLVVAHNHPGGSAMHSKDDKDAFSYIKSLIVNLECKLLDSFVVGDDGIYSEKQKAFVRSFTNNDNIIDLDFVS